MFRTENEIEIINRKRDHITQMLNSLSWDAREILPDEDPPQDSLAERLIYGPGLIATEVNQLAHLGKETEHTGWLSDVHADACRLKRKALEIESDIRQGKKFNLYDRLTELANIAADIEGLTAEMVGNAPTTTKTIDISRLDIRVDFAEDSIGHRWTIHYKNSSELLAYGENRYGIEAWIDVERWCQANGFLSVRPAEGGECVADVQSPERNDDKPSSM